MVRRFGIVRLDALQFNCLHRRRLALDFLLQPLKQFVVPGHHVVQLLDLMLEVRDVCFQFFNPLGRFICHEKILPARGREVEASLALRALEIWKHWCDKRFLMPRKTPIQKPAANVMILGVGSFAHSIGQTLADAGANVSTYLTRNYGHFSPTLVGKTFSRDAFPSPVPLIRENKIDVVIPQSIDWATATVGEGFDQIRRRNFFSDRRSDAD